MAGTRKREEAERALARPDPAIRCYLLYGPDDSGSRALAAKLAMALGPDAERIDLSPAQLKGDPALLADEAAAVSLFGGARHVRVEGAGDECLAAVEALLEAPAAGNPVVLIGGGLRRDARIVKRVEGDRAGFAFASYAPEGLAADRLAAEIAQAHGLRLEPEVARRLAEGANNDRAVIAREIEKMALFLDAAPERPGTVSHATLDAIGVDGGDARESALMAALFGGDTAALDRELARRAEAGQDGVPLVLAVLRRLMILLPARLDMDGGGSAMTGVMRAAGYLPESEKKAIAAVLPRWPAARLAAAVERLSEMARTQKSSRGPGSVAADQLLLTMARSVRR